MTKMCMCIVLTSDGSVVKNPSAVQEMQVQSLGQEDALEEKMATHSNILAWKIPLTEATGTQKSDTT